MNLNKVFLLGRLTRDPESRATPSGKTVVNVGLATNTLRMDKEGKRVAVPEYHNIVLFGRLGEVAAQYLKKGSLCLIVGRIQTRKWQGQDGQKRQKTEIIAEELQLGPRGFDRAGGASESAHERPVVEEVVEEVVENQPKRKTASAPNPDDEINVEDIPF